MRPPEAPRRSPSAGRHLAAARVVAVALLAGVAGCTSGQLGADCDPACAPGYRCDVSARCVPDENADASVPDLLPSGRCSPACSGGTPHCDQGRCAACLVDDHCPAGHVCRTLGAGAAATRICAPGCADDARCGGGAARCCGGACVDTATDPAHCGGCDAPCVAPHRAPRCEAGACVPGACEAGYGDCNGLDGDGCEVGLRVDAENCMACGAGCAFPQGVGACANGCYLAGCDFGRDDCNGDALDGCESAVLEDPANCGGCGQACGKVDHGLAGCANATCFVGSCEAGWADCDQDARNGCEVDVATQDAHCGACGQACPAGLMCRKGACTCPMCEQAFANAAARCEIVANVPNCIFEKCNPGFTDCDRDLANGCEVDTGNDAKNCGACGSACPQGLLCRNGSCTSAVRITVEGEAYGHHGMCMGWNGCNDAMTCALWACRIKGFQQLVGFGRTGPCTQFVNCHLFNDMNNLDVNWGNTCEVAGVSEIDCK